MKRLNFLLLPTLVIAQPLSGADAPPPGEGVLCLGTMVYYVQAVGQRCHANEDLEFQARIAGYAGRFDEYITRNVEGGATALQRFKEDEGIGARTAESLCSGDTAEIYEHFRQAEPRELETAVDALLARDGTPSYGDCL